MPENEEILERLRKSGGEITEYLKLLPETAQVMGVSCTTLQSRPVEVQLLLTKTYVNNWDAGKEALQEALQHVMELDFSAGSQSDRMSEKSDLSEKAQQQENQTQGCRQQETQQHARRILFSQELLRREATRIHQQGRQKQEQIRQQAQENQLERTRNQKS